MGAWVSEAKAMSGPAFTGAGSAGGWLFTAIELMVSMEKMKVFAFIKISDSPSATQAGDVYKIRQGQFNYC